MRTDPEAELVEVIIDPVDDQTCNLRVMRMVQEPLAQNFQKSWGAVLEWLQGRVVSSASIICSGAKRLSWDIHPYEGPS